MLVDESLNPTRIDEPARIGHGPAPDDRFQGLIDDARDLFPGTRVPARSPVDRRRRKRLRQIAALPPNERRTPAQRRKLRWAISGERTGHRRCSGRSLEGSPPVCGLEREDYVAIAADGHW